MKHLLLVLILLLALVPCVSAATYEITAEPLGGTLLVVPGHPTDITQDYSTTGEAIQRMTLDIPTGTRVDYTLWYGNGSTVTGHMIYQPAPGMCGGALIPCQFAEVAIGTSVNNHYYVGVQEIGRINIVGYGRETSADPDVPGILVWDQTGPLHIPGDAIAFHPSSGVIYKYHLESNKPLTGLAIYVNNRENVQKAASTSLFDVANEWMKFASEISNLVLSFLKSMLLWISFILQNWDLIVYTYVLGSGAFAARSARGNIGRFFRQWVGDQIALVRFIIDLIYQLVNIPATIRRIFP